MVIVLWIVIVILGLVALFYRSKANEFESLFELSKTYEPVITPNKADMIVGLSLFKNEYTVKLNKDGSIAKKRGPKPKGVKNVKTT